MPVSEVANRVIDLAQKVRAYYDTELPKRHPNYPLVGPDEESPPPPPEEKELSEFLTTLSDELIYQLILIQYLGRGELGTDNLADYYDSLKETVGDPGDAMALMIMDRGILAGELTDGLEELRKHKIPVDKLPLKKVKVRKR